MVRAEPEAAVRTNPPAVVKATVERGSSRKVGEGAGAAVEKERRQAAIANTIKPCASPPRDCTHFHLTHVIFPNVNKHS